MGPIEVDTYPSFSGHQWDLSKWTPIPHLVDTNGTYQSGHLYPCFSGHQWDLSKWTPIPLLVDTNGTYRSGHLSFF